MWMGFVFDPYCCVNSLQEFFLANRGGDHNSQTNGKVQQIKTQNKEKLAKQ